MGKFLALPLAVLLGLLTCTPPSAVAQTRQFNVGIARINSGTTIPVQPSSDGDDTLYLDPGKAVSGSLTAAEDVFDSSGNLAIPEGSVVEGTYQPVKGGLKFYAKTLVVRGIRYPLKATSKLIRDQKDPREYSTGALAGDAAIGAAGGALIGALTGGVNLGGTLAGAAAGAAVGNITAPQVVVIGTNNPIELRVQSSLTVRN